MLQRQLAHRFEIARLRQDAAGVAHHRLGEHGGDAVALARDCVGQRLRVVPRQDDEVFFHAFRHARALRHRNRAVVGTGLGNVRMLAPVHAVGKAVIHAFEADDLVALGERAGEARRVEHRLGAGVAQAHHVHARHRVDDFLRETRFVRRRQREHGAALLDEIDHGLGDARRAVAEDHRTQAEQIVDVLVAVDVGETRAFALVDEQRIRVPARPGRARRAVDAARDELACGVEQFGAAARVEAGDELGIRHGGISRKCISLLVIPAKAGIQPFSCAPQEQQLDPSFRWDDEMSDERKF